MGLYQMLKNHGATIPEEGLAMIRFHSFYAWHNADGGGAAYSYLCNDKDREMLKWVKEFNQFDLYSKSDRAPTAEEIEELKTYYGGLIEKYIGAGPVKW